MNIQNLLFTSESYTHDNWVYKNIYSGFSRLYYVIDGEAYYEENGKKIMLKKNHLYITPAKKRFDLYDDPENKLLHSYAHITTTPAIVDLVEIEVVEGTPLHDGVMLWRKYIHSGDDELLRAAIRFLLSCIDFSKTRSHSAASMTKTYIDGITTSSLDMDAMCKELGYSREHLSRSFQAEYGITPKKYFNLQRMNLGLKLLLEGKSVTETSELLNYATPYSFSKAFKNHFGFSPEKYLFYISDN